MSSASSSHTPSVLTDGAVPIDPLRLDADQIEALAASNQVRTGLRLCTNRCVTALQRTEDSLWARVEDEQSGEQLDLEVVIDGDGAIKALCACEPAGPDDAAFGPLCVHAIAALFASTQGQGDAGQIADVAAETGRGVWSAHSIQSSGLYPARYRVHIRSFERRANH